MASNQVLSNLPSSVADNNDEITGYDFESPNDLPDELVCVICQFIVRNATGPPCQDAFCRTCLVKWQQKQKKIQGVGKQIMECPKCKRTYKKEEMIPLLIIDKMVKTSIDVFCPQTELGCQWFGKISEYFEGHIKRCPYITINCKYIGCQKEFRRHEEKTHLKICDFRTIACEFCGEDQPFNKLEDHHAICPLLPVTCINEGCEVKVPRETMDVHVRERCLFQVISCQYESLGCTHQFKRAEQESHNTLFLQNHFKMMFNNVMSLTQELQETKANLNFTRVKLRDTSEKLIETEVELRETSEKLIETQVELRDTKTELHEILNEIRDSTTKVNEEYRNNIETLAKAINNPQENDILNQFDDLPKPRKEIILHINSNVYNFNQPPQLKDVMLKMEVGRIYSSVDDRRKCFKLSLKSKTRMFGWNMNNVKEMERRCKNDVTFSNNHLCLLERVDHYNLYIDETRHVKGKLYLFDVNNVNINKVCIGQGCYFVIDYNKYVNDHNEILILYEYN